MTVSAPKLRVLRCLRCGHSWHENVPEESLPLTHEQGLIFRLAWAKMREQLQDQGLSAGRALEFMAAEFLAGP